MQASPGIGFDKWDATSNELKLDLKRLKELLVLNIVEVSLWKENLHRRKVGHATKEPEPRGKTRETLLWLL